MKVTTCRRGRVFWIRYRDQGRQVRRSLRTENRKIAEDLRVELEWKLRRGEMPLPERRILVERFRGEYEAHSLAHKRPKSHRTDMGRIEAFLSSLDRTTLQEVSTRDVSEFLARKALVDGSATATLLRYREALHAFFQHAIRLGYLGSNPVSRVPRPSLPQRDPRFLSRDQIEELLDAFQRDELRPLMATAVFAGLRRAELCWLTRDDLTTTPRGPVLRVRGKTVEGVSWLTKTGRNRSVPISSRLAPLLVEAAQPRNGRPWLFATPRGKRWDPDNLSAQLRRRMRSAGLPWNLLDLRHTFGSQLARKGVSLLKIAALMGNSPEIARRHYVHLLPEEMHEEVEF